MNSTERFRLRVDHRVEGGMLLLFIAMALVFGTLFSKRDAPLWTLGLVSLPLGIGIAICLWSLLARSATLLLDETAIELQEGSSRIGPKPWRLAWTEIQNVVISHGLFGEQLVFHTRETSLTVPLESKTLGWRLERREDLIADLTARGLAPMQEVVADGESVESFPLYAGRGWLSSRTVLAWTLVILIGLIGMEIASHRWDRVPTHALFVFTMGTLVLGGARSLSRLDVSDEAVTLRLLTPKGFLAVYRFHPAWKIDTLWTARWDEIRRVRLGRQEGHGRDLWMEIETVHTKHRLVYRDAKGDIGNADRLRHLFNIHGFPIELVLWPENFRVDRSDEDRTG